jgi:integrase
MTEQKLPKKPPKFALHRPSGHARVTVDGKRIYLGPYDSAEARQRYAEILTRWDQKRKNQIPTLSLATLAILYDCHVKSYYRKDGNPTSEQAGIRAALKYLMRGYRLTNAGEFTPKDLKAVREKMIEAGLCRNTINHNINRIRRFFRWAVSENLLVSAVSDALASVAGLEYGRSDAVETAPVAPADRKDVAAIRKFVAPVVYDMVQLQIFTGMRPGEVVKLRTRDLVRQGKTWKYDVPGHKTAHLGRKRVVFFGPKAQRVLVKYLKPKSPDAFLFAPQDILASQGKTRRRRGRAPGSRYSVNSYRRAIARGCELAFAMPAELRKIPRNLAADEKADRRERAASWRAEHCWFPNQLRHTAGTSLRHKSNLETARTVLGHSSQATTEIYAEQDQQTARKLMARVG